MFKATVCLTCKDDMTHQEFREYYENNHAPGVNDVPVILRYTLAFIESDDSPYDSVAELYFEDEAAYERATSSGPMAKIVADIETFAKADEMLLVAGEESVLLDTLNASR